ncbi:MAG: chalcone isomerase family protein [Deltaproteobacteria bacterium]|nr:chalcone isomerase family protein [Deltaproteobacteria bacterium]
MIRAALLMVTTLSLSSAALAVEVSGVKVKDTATVGGEALVLNGAGLRTKVVFNVYVASLYLPAKATDLAGVLAKGPRRVQLNMLRTLAADALIEAFNDGFKDNNSAAEMTATKAGREQMTTIMKGFGEIKEGAVVGMDYAAEGTTISLNGVAKGTIPGAAFNTAVMKIWLGDKPVQADLKKALLGG